MKKLFLFFLSFFFVNFLSYAAFQPVTSIDDVNIKDIAISSFYPNIIYIASRNSLYKSKDSGENFRKVDSFIGEEIRQIFFHPTQVGILYLVTSKRLYQVTDRKERIFNLDSDDDTVLAAANHNGLLYVGTTDGLYLSGQDYLNWRKIQGLSQRDVYWIEPSQRKVYLAASDGVYTFDEEGSLERVFVLRKFEADETPLFIPHRLKIDIFNQERIWLATSKGLFVSRDKARSFNKFFVAGIDNLNIFSLAQTNLEKNSLYLATERGFFRVDLERKEARGLYAGLYASRVNQAQFTECGELYLATDKGAFTNQYFTLPARNKNLEKVLAKQPSIEFVHQATMDFNEVSPDKISEWRRGASLSPLFPQMRFKVGEGERDRYQGSTVDPATDRWVRYHEDFSWDVTVTWDLADLVWNPSQTSIDTRSRLNTQLRIDILESVNRIYFERLRFKKRLQNSLMAEEEEARKQLRLKELTAMLDYYTGGAFSQRLKELNER